MSKQDIIKSIKNYQDIVKDANCGSFLTDEKVYEILMWSQQPDVAQTVAWLRSEGKAVEGPGSDEPLFVVDSNANKAVLHDLSEFAFPRWVSHLLGIRHRTAHAVVVLHNGLYIIQRRSRNKDVSPGAFDIAVGGHLKGDCTFSKALAEEMYEEIGLRKFDVAQVTELGVYESCSRWPEKNFHSIEVRDVFEVKLLEESFSKIKFVDNEVSGVYICDENEAMDMLKTDYIASGLEHTMPRYIEWKTTGNNPFKKVEND